MDAGRRHEIPGLETKEFVTHNNSSSQSVSIFLHQFPLGMVKSVLWYLYSALCYRRGTLSSGFSQIFYIGQEACFPFAPEEDHIFQGCFPYKHLWKDNLEPMAASVLFMVWTETQETYRELFLTNMSFLHRP